MSVRGIAAKLGISRNTVRKWMRKDDGKCLMPRGPEDPRKWRRIQKRKYGNKWRIDYVLVQELLPRDWTSQAIILSERKLCHIRRSSDIWRKPAGEKRHMFSVSNHYWLKRTSETEWHFVQEFTQKAFVMTRLAVKSNERTSCLLMSHQCSYSRHQIGRTEEFEPASRRTYHQSEDRSSIWRPWWQAAYRVTEKQT